MKLIIALVLSLGLANVASAGFGDFFKTKEISKKMLKRVMNNHLIVAKVKHPAPGLELFDACLDGDTFVSKSGAVSSVCVEREYEVDPDRRGEILGSNFGKDVLTQEEFNRSSQKGFYTPSCIAFKEFEPSGSINRTARKAVNCRKVAGRNLPSNHPQYNETGESGTLYTICDYKSVPTTFPVTQTIEVHTLKDNFSDKVYYHSSHHDRANPGFRKFTYTIPFCQDLSSK